MAELVDTNSATAKASDIVESKTAYVKSGLVVGTIPKQAGSTIIPGTSSTTAIERGKYMTGDTVMAGDASLVPENIVKDVTMFGVKGTWEGEPPPPTLPTGFYEINVQSEPEFAGEVSGGGIASQGMLVTVDAKQDNRFYEFSGWKENGSIVGDKASYQINVKEPHTISATFERPIVDWFESDKLPKSYMGSMAYGNEPGVFVAVGGNTNAMYSYDGITWVSSSLPSISTSFTWRDAAYGNGYFVAVGYISSTMNQNNFAYSSNGRTWTSGTFPTPGDWNCVAYGNSRFIALRNNARGSRLLYTKTSIPIPSNWEYTDSPVNTLWRDIVWGADKFVAVGDGVGMYSFDGIEWIKGDSIPWAQCIVYGDGKFVAIPFSAEEIYVSKDGLTWQSVGFPLSGLRYYYWSIAYGDGKFVAVGSSSSMSTKADKVVIISEDGVTWKTGTLPVPAHLGAVAYGNEKFVTLTDDGSYQAFYGEHRNLYTISAVAEPAGSSAITGRGFYFEGESVAIAASSTEVWYEFKEWRENSNVVSNNPEYIFVASKDRTLTAVSNILRYTISGEANPKEGGYITGIGEYLKGETAKLNVVENYGYEFLSWTENGTIVHNGKEYSFAVDRDRNLTASFYAIPRYNISAIVEPVDGGSVTGTGVYLNGETVTLTVRRNDGYLFNGWYENGQEIGKSDVLSFVASKDRSLLARFREGLPSGYTELEYIESTEKQAIDTGVSPTDSTRVVMDISPLVISSEGIGPYFFRSYASSYYFALRNLYSKVEATIGKISNSVYVDSISAQKRIVVKLDAINFTGSVGDTTVTLESSAFPDGLPNLILLSYSKSGGTSSMSAHLYSCKIYDGDALVRDFVPCTNPSGIAGLFDSVGKVFYPSSSSTAFIAGPAV